jgi:Mg2+/Co2+ transporter CorC
MLIFMYIMSPIAYPIALLLDSWLGVHHGTTYRRTELKTLVSLHQVNGIGELTDDEVTIIASVLDLKEKPVSMVMTPLEDVFTLSEDAILDEELMEEIVSAGYSRIPIYRHDDPSNFIGMLLVKRLITYDPEDHIAVRQFKINSLPEAAPNTSCLDILNFFQEGRSHMAMVTSEPGGFGLPVGVITLEDVIEELLGEEIVDESDVYVDVHNKIRVIRKPTKSVHMIQNLKNLLQSPALSEAATPLMGPTTSMTGHAGVVMHPTPQIERRLAVEVPNQYMSGKTILQSRKTSIGGMGENQPLLDSDGGPHHCEFRTGSYTKYDHYTEPKSPQQPYTHQPQQQQHSHYMDSNPAPEIRTPKAPQLGDAVSITMDASAPVHNAESLPAPALPPTINNNSNILDTVSASSTLLIRPESTASTTVTEAESPVPSTGSKKKKKKKKSQK